MVGGEGVGGGAIGLEVWCPCSSGGTLCTTKASGEVGSPGWCESLAGSFNCVGFL